MQQTNCFVRKINYWCLKKQYRKIANVSNVTLFSFSSPKLRDHEYEKGKKCFSLYKTWGHLDMILILGTAFLQKSKFVFVHSINFIFFLQAVDR